MADDKDRIMRCDDVRDRLSALLDGELSAEERETVCKHLESCASCRAERRAIEATVRAVRALPTVAAPAGLRDRVMALIAESGAAAPEKRVPLWRILWPAAAAIVIAVVIGLVNLPGSAPRPAAENGMVARMTGPASQDEAAGPVVQPVLTAADPAERKKRDADGTARAGRLLAKTENQALPPPTGPAPEAAAAPARDAGSLVAVAPPAPAAPIEDARKLRADSADGAGATRRMEKAAAAAAPMKTLPLAPITVATLQRKTATEEVAAAPLVEEITIINKAPQDAYARALALVKDGGWKVLEPGDGASGLLRKEADPPRICLQLKASDLPRLREALTAGKLLMAAPHEATADAMTMKDVESKSLARGEQRARTAPAADRAAEVAAPADKVKPTQADPVVRVSLRFLPPETGAKAAESAE